MTTTPTKQPSAEMIDKIIAEAKSAADKSHPYLQMCDSDYMNYYQGYLAAKAADHAEMMKAAPEFDSKAVCKEFDTYEKGIFCIDSAIRFARWQHQQSAAQIAALQQENERLRSQLGKAENLMRRSSTHDFRDYFQSKAEKEA